MSGFSATEGPLWGGYPTLYSPRNSTSLFDIFKFGTNFGRRSRVALTPLMRLLAFLLLVWLKIIIRGFLDNFRNDVSYKLAKNKKELATSRLTP
jgi:hypothetical protein